MRLQTLCVLLISALTLAGCSTAIYKQASGPTSLGYSEAPLEDGRYRVTFRGRNFNTAYDFALLRAAEITLAKGHIWFRVTNSFSDEDQDHGHNSHVSIGSGYGHYGHRGRHWRNHWGNDWSVGFGFPIGSTYRNALHSIDIQMGDGTKPEGGEDDDRIYDAASVKATIGAQIGRTNPDN